MFFKRLQICQILWKIKFSRVSSTSQKKIYSAKQSVDFKTKFRPENTYLFFVSARQNILRSVCMRNIGLVARKSLRNINEYFCTHVLFFVLLNLSPHKNCDSLFNCVWRGLHDDWNVHELLRPFHIPVASQKQNLASICNVLHFRFSRSNPDKRPRFDRVRL